MKRQLFLVTAAFGFVLGVCSAPRARSQSPPARFDHKVRNDVFAGYAGDAAAMARGAAVLATVLKDNPNHAEAMAWLGSVKVFEAGQLFRKGGSQDGMALWNEGLELMNRAVSVAPDHIGVRIPRGATLAAATPNMPPDYARPLVELAYGDYAKAYELQKDRLDRLSEHSRGELYLGLADLSERSGRDWRVWARRAAEELPKESPYARRAAAWLEKGDLRPGARTCLGCHAGPQEAQ